jgi:hypothetical protein
MGEAEREYDWEEELFLECCDCDCDCDLGEEVSTVRPGIAFLCCFLSGAIFRSRGGILISLAWLLVLVSESESEPGKVAVLGIYLAEDR